MRRRDPRPAGRTTVPGAAADRRFPGYDVIAQASAWDPVTSGVVLDRLGIQPALRFFTPAEEAAAQALFDQLLAQWDEPKVPVLQMIDARLAEAQTDGWRYEDMPEDGDAWRASLAGLDADAAGLRGETGVCFAGLAREEQAFLIRAVQDAKDKTWHGMPAGHVWSLWTRYACTAFYSHPWAWNEIGFGGPAYPRGYGRLGLGLREPWEVSDHSGEEPS